MQESVEFKNLVISTQRNCSTYFPKEEGNELKVLAHFVKKGRNKFTPSQSTNQRLRSRFVYGF